MVASLGGNHERHRNIGGTPALPVAPASISPFCDWVFTLGWTTYVIYLPRLAAEVGIAPSAVILILCWTRPDDLRWLWKPWVQPDDIAGGLL
jgi:hypothetical protein